MIARGIRKASTFPGCHDDIMTRDFEIAQKLFIQCLLVTKTSFRPKTFEI